MFHNGCPKNTFLFTLTTYNSVFNSVKKYENPVEQAWAAPGFGLKARGSEKEGKKEGRRSKKNYDFKASLASHLRGFGLDLS